MKRFREEKGITLIALIITIIIMLILVIVTVAFTMNGGLFNRAKEASAETEKKAIAEMIFGSYILNNDGTINLTSTVSNAIDALESDGKTAEIALKVPTDNPELIVLKVNGKTGTYYYEIKGGYALSVILLEEGEDGEGNKTLTGGENEYNVSDNGEISISDGQSGGGNQSSSIWPMLTEEQKTELVNYHDHQDWVEGESSDGVVYGEGTSDGWLIAKSGNIEIRTGVYDTENVKGWMVTIVKDSSDFESFMMFHGGDIATKVLT